ncbi:hypothetical protein LOTGIDRAFT_209139 [Lottia gigantea]|uniref:phosphorylase kinase n=1 Tax=Lottia gigantea TaxID=225164 RepID=V4ALF6_LOTGI|nr:hypothetical protein LOTGIDRAFT_209139 [Lottia gigantea]ESO97942.1 hypothetical protein LOTGIDRAFT_209139 [Lottia gigantea]
MTQDTLIEDSVDGDLPSRLHAKEFYAKYEPREILGKGVSSTVRKCFEKKTGTEYAVKIIDISGEKGETYQVAQVKKDTYREINILRMCAGHDNIIELHDWFETPTFIFLVFELCKKGELFDYLTEVVSLSEKRTRIIMRQLLEAVLFVHDKGIVHRDLKPENILLDDNLNVKVSDFGFATTVTDHELTGKEVFSLCGTPGYLAPEVLAVSMYDNAPGYGKEVDMWACGVIMYTLLCGSPPFWHRKQMLMLRAIMQGNYSFGSPEWDDISDVPKDLISKLLVVEPSNRLNIKECLAHPFFVREVSYRVLGPQKKFYARRVFRVSIASRYTRVSPTKSWLLQWLYGAAIICARFFYRLHFFYTNPLPISSDVIKTNPYSVKLFRKLIDGCAFGMYGHWVKRGDNQNRAALFEHVLRDDWKTTVLSANAQT